jgi:hypothetical protein
MYGFYVERIFGFYSLWTEFIEGLISSEQQKEDLGQRNRMKSFFSSFYCVCHVSNIPCVIYVGEN